MISKWFLFLVLIAQVCWSQDEEGPYRGKFIGKLNSYHHQVSGDVYAVNEGTILIVNFNYDGTGDDTFFWAGDSGRPGPQGFIIPDQHGKTNILERYYNEDVQLTMPEGKGISRIKWFAIYDIGSQNAFGDVYIPDDFNSPSEKTIGPLIGHGISSQSVRILDASTILIPEFKYDGDGEDVFFWVGVGPQPSERGTLVPDEYGYLEPLGKYHGEDVRLQLPGDTTVLAVRWLSVWSRAARRSLAGVLLPAAPDVPPADRVALPYKSALPNCKQLHRDYQVSWEVFGNQVTFELAAKLEEGEYMSFGISGSEQSSRMLGADVAVAHYDRKLQRAFATDYNITDYSPCVPVLGRWRGVCRDEWVGGRDSHQVLAASTQDGLTRVSYRRELISEDMDRPWATDRPVHVVWAVGALDEDGEPAYHRLRPNTALPLRLSPNPPINDCVSFTQGGSAPPVSPWEVAMLSDPALRVFTFRVGPAGGARGGGGAGGGRGGSLAWYVNGQLAPDLQLRRGLHYTLLVHGGNNPHSATEYHPLVVTRSRWARFASPPGAASPPTGAAPPVALAGVHYPRRGPPSPTAAGGLCLGRLAADGDPRRAGAVSSFRAYNRSLWWRCEGPPARLQLAPNASWPDLVYYNSFTHPGMGGRIFIVDKHRRSARRPSAATAVTPSVVFALAVVGIMALH